MGKDGVEVKRSLVLAACAVTLVLVGSETTHAQDGGAYWHSHSDSDDEGSDFSDDLPVFKGKKKARPVVVEAASGGVPSDTTEYHVKIRPLGDGSVGGGAAGGCGGRGGGGSGGGGSGGGGTTGVVGAPLGGGPKPSPKKLPSPKSIDPTPDWSPFLPGKPDRDVESVIDSLPEIIIIG